MTSYTALAPYYDALMSQADYVAWADFAERHLTRLRSPEPLVLDLACGTGRLSCLLAERGYDVIGVDASADMLSCAMQRAYEQEKRPLFLCQTAQALDLYGTVKAAVSSMDSLNYIVEAATLKKALAKVALFLEPGGLFLFDARTPAHFMSAHGQTFVTQDEELFCSWHTDWQPRHMTARHDVTIFAKEASLWRRMDEVHNQRAYTQEQWVAFLQQAGFTDIRLFGDKVMRRPKPSETRIFISARKPVPRAQKK